MATLIGALLLLIAAFQIYRAARRALTQRPEGNAVPSHIGDDRDDPTPSVAPELADTAAEARECALSRQLIAGHLDPTDYQRLMGELADASTQAGGPR